MRVGEERAVSMKSCGAVKERATLLKDSKTPLTIGRAVNAETAGQRLQMTEAFCN